MAFTRRDFMKAAVMVRTTARLARKGKTHTLDARDRYVAAMLLRDFFQASDPLFDGEAFLIECGMRDIG